MKPTNTQTKYKELSSYLKKEIFAGRMRHGQKLPTEKQLAVQFSVSRITVRGALAVLQQEGFINKVQGKGSFAVQPRKRMQVQVLEGFSQEMKKKGLLPSTQVLKVDVMQADEEIACRLNLEPKELVYKVVRLRLANNTPMCIEAAHLPKALCPSLEQQNLEKSLYKLMEEVYGFAIHHACQEIEAGLVGPKEGTLLGVAVGAPALMINRTTFLQTGVPFEYVSSVYRGDQYTIIARLELAGIAGR